MAQEPKRRHSKMRKRTRRASIKLDALGLIVCTNCQKMTIPHQVCTECGFYKGEKVSSKTAVEVVKA